jgi:hypothetical protein
MSGTSRLLHRCLVVGAGLAMAGLATGVTPAAAQAGTVSTARIITLAATKSGRLTVTVTSGLVQSIPVVTDNAVNAFPGPAVVLTQWDLNPGQTNTVNLVAYFSLPSQAMTGPTNIPSSRILGRMTTGAPVTFTAITQNGIGGVGTAGGSLRLFSQNITGANKTASRTDNLDLQLDLSGLTLPVGNYTGTLNIRAITQ